ncbi:MAG: M56 family metallopeptidase [Cyclobacteriaceae bacterium]
MMEAYLLKSSLAMAVLYLAYRLITHHEPNHQLNRFIGLAFVLFSSGFLFLPLEHLFGSYTTSETFTVLIQGANDIQTNFTPTNTGDSMPAYMIIYWIGLALFTLRSISGAATLIYHYFNSEKYHRWGFMVVALAKDVSPFTFFNILFIGNQRLKNENHDVMLVHEQVHRDQWHSLDTLILEVLTILFWFNPFVWLFRRNIKAEHEYQADAEVLKRGINKLDYQRLLFETKTGVSIQLGNYLSNKTSLSKRFNQMKNKNINVRMSFARVGVALMTMATMLFVSACTEMSNQVDVQPEYEEGMSVLYKTIGDNIRYPKSAREEHSVGLMYVSFTVNAQGEIEDIIPDKQDGYMLTEVVVVGYPPEGTATNVVAKSAEASEDIKAEAVRTVKLLGKFNPAQKDGKAVGSVLVLPIKFKLAD